MCEFHKGQSQMNSRIQTTGRILLLFAILVSVMSAPLTAQAAPAGYSEYYLPGSTDQLFQILKDIDNDPDLGNALGGGGTCTVAPCNRMHNVVTVSVSTDSVTVYYDHWENGYGTGSTGIDETYVVNKGDVLTFESTNILVPRIASNTCTSTNENGASTACYDGRDRIYVAGGAVTVAEAFWPEVAGTVFANAWEVYPVKPYQSNYTIPVGEDLSGAPLNYTDFNQVFVIAQATQDNTNIQIDNPATAGVELNVTLDRGETTQLFHVNAGTTVTGSAPLQVQFIAGQPNAGLNSDSRSYTAVPSTLWEFEYYGPVPSFGGGSNTDVFIYNPTASPLSINYQDNLGSGSFVLPAGATRSYQALVGRFVPADSALYLAASDGVTHFWAIGSANTENADYNYGFTFIPTTTLTREYYISWAPGTTDLSDNGSPVFVTPIVDNTIIFVDYSPNDGVVDATYTLDRIQMQRIFDPDNDNTGMHIWATNPIVVVWGEDANPAGTENPYIDAGYSILPLNETWIDVVLTLDKSADPSVIALAVGQTSTFTLVTKTQAVGLQDVSILDTLPPGWGYVAGSSVITLPNGTPISGASADPTIAGQNLTWSNFPVGPLDMNSNETLTIKFQGITTSVPTSDVFVNEATATGTNGTETFSATDIANVFVSDLVIDKVSNTGGTVNPGDPITYTVGITNNGAVPHNNIVVTDPLPVGTTYTTQSTVVTGFVSETAGDAFNAIAFTGDQDSNGATDPSWFDNWTEVGEADGAGAGDVQILNNISNYQLRIQNSNNGGEGISRQVDLSACTTATLSLSYRRNALDTATDLVRLSIGASGTLTDTLTDFAGPNNDALYQSYNVDITNWISAQTRIQLLSSATLGAADQIFFDNILITCYLPTIKDNIPAASNPDLASGTPATLTASSDSFDLAPGATMTVSYQVLVDNPVPVGQTNVVNLVSVTSDEQPDPLYDSVTDLLPAQTPQISVSKVAFPTSVPETGGSVTFTYTVTNIGPINVNITSLTDDRFGTMTGDADCQVGTLLIPNASCTFDFTTTLSGLANTPHINIFTANAVDANNNVVNDNDDAIVTFTPIPSGLTKSLAATDSIFTAGTDVAIGETLTYQITFAVPQGVYPNLTIVDTLDRGLAYVDCVSVNAPNLTTNLQTGFANICTDEVVSPFPLASVDPIDVDRRVTFNFGTVTNINTQDQTLTILYRAIVLNNNQNQDGLSLNNSAQLIWNNIPLNPVSTTVQIVEPDLSIDKTSNVSTIEVGSEVTFTLTIQHTQNSHTDALDVVVEDALPTALDFVNGSLDCTTGAQDPAIADCFYNPVTRVVHAEWDIFTLGGGVGQVRFRVTGNANLSANSNVTNIGTVAWTSMPGDLSAPRAYTPNQFSTERDYDPGDPVNVYGTNDALVLTPPDDADPPNPPTPPTPASVSAASGFLIPVTGFAPNVTTDISLSPRAAYTDTAITLEIPALSVNIPIVGVPRKDGAWNVAWLGNQAGWLEGSAFPSWNGNSVLTSHVYLSNGKPGPFAKLHELKYGDQIIVHAYGQKYIFELRTYKVVAPNDKSIMKHEERPWLTLVTCMNYDEKTDTYKNRFIVRAVLVKVTDGK